MRLDKKLKQEELAKMLRVSRSVLSGYETGKKNLNANVISKYNEIFNVNLEQELDIIKKDKMIIKSFRIPEELFSDLERNANDKETDVSSYIRFLIESGMDQEYLKKGSNQLMSIVEEAMKNQWKIREKQQNERDIQMEVIKQILVYLLQYTMNMSSSEIEKLIQSFDRQARDSFFIKMRK